MVRFSRREGLFLMLGASQVALVRAASATVTLVGAWPMSETSGNIFADTVGGNTATLTVPSWTFATHEHNRPGIVSGSDHALEISNGGPAIPMVAGYKQAEMSLVLYVQPRGELRGCQYWNVSDERYGREFLAYCDNGSTPGSFAIYRRRNGLAGLLGISGTPQWRLGGYVRNSSGAKVYFGGPVTGLSGALLPVDTAKRIVLTQGASGARLYLDGSQVASLPSVTQGWRCGGGRWRSPTFRHGRLRCSQRSTVSRPTALWSTSAIMAGT